jgi:hypothetical protein
MRRTLRADRALGRVLAAPSSQYTCAACRTQTSNFSTRASSRAILDTEKWRKKIWGTDKPPGAADPYGGPSAAEKYAAERKEKTGADEEARVVEEDMDMSTYEPADNWVGLEEVGGKGIWWKGRPEPGFEGYIPAQKITDPYELTAALHRTVVEVFALRAADLPLEKLASAGAGPDFTSEVQIVASGDGGELKLPKDMILEEITQSLESQIDETSAKTNPSPSEEDVAADRSTIDPLLSEEAKRNLKDETKEKGNPSDSELDVAADRSDVDPLHKLEFQHMVESWDPIWLNVSLADPEVKFAVSHSYS